MGTFEDAKSSFKDAVLNLQIKDENPVVLMGNLALATWNMGNLANWDTSGMEMGDLRALVIRSKEILDTQASFMATMLFEVRPNDAFGAIVVCRIASSLQFIRELGHPHVLRNHSDLEFCLHWCLKSGPNWDFSTVEMVIARMKGPKWSKNHWWWKELIKKGSNDVPEGATREGFAKVKADRARMEYAREQYDLAAFYASQAEHLNPGLSQYSYLRAKALHKQGDLQAALRLCRDLTKAGRRKRMSESLVARIFVLEGRIHQKLGDYETGEYLTTKAVRLLGETAVKKAEREDFDGCQELCSKAEAIAKRNRIPFPVVADVGSLHCRALSAAFPVPSEERWEIDTAKSYFKLAWRLAKNFFHLRKNEQPQFLFTYHFVSVMACRLIHQAPPEVIRRMSPDFLKARLLQVRAWKKTGEGAEPYQAPITFDEERNPTISQDIIVNAEGNLVSRLSGTTPPLLPRPLQEQK